MIDFYTSIPERCLGPTARLYLQAFNRYFGEDRVDVQPTTEVLANAWRSFIGQDIRTANIPATDCVKFIIHFPHVTVENSQNDKEEIDDLYVCVVPRATYIRATRTTFTEKQACCGYVHSHIPSMYFSNISGDSDKWGQWCLGSGPITHTLRTLRDADLNTLEDMLPLLCIELDNLTKVESLEGGPYMRMHSMGGGFREVSSSGNLFRSNRRTSTEVINDGGRSYNSIFVRISKWFAAYIKENDCLKFKIYDGKVTLAENLIDICIKMTNAFNANAPEALKQDFENNVNRHRYALKERVILRNGVLTKLTDGGESRYSSCVGLPWIKFKGEDKLFRVTTRGEMSGFEVVSPSLYLPLIAHFLKYLTLYCYDKQQQK